METTNEELKSTNEEMQSVNEELQSTNEELETSKEELQSVNEELTTVNAELQDKVGGPVPRQQRHEQPARRHRVGTVFVDSQLRIAAFHAGGHSGHQPDLDRRRAAARPRRDEP